MGNAQWALEAALMLLLAATLFHAIRLERALGVLKRDRAVLEELVEGFNDSTRQAESGIERLRVAADGAGRQIARQTELAQRLRDDLTFLSDRGDRLAERLEGAVRTARMAADGAAMTAPVVPPMTVTAGLSAPPMPGTGAAQMVAEQEAEFQPRLRSQAERDLLRALRGNR